MTEAITWLGAKKGVQKGKKRAEPFGSTLVAGFTE